MSGDSVEYIGVKRSMYGSRRFVWRVCTEVGDVFMRAEPSASGEFDRDQMIVVVDRNRLLDLWRACPFGHERQFAGGTVASWKADYKYASADSGFQRARHIADPVPVCDLSTRQEGQRTFIAGFTDGITRTVWLLANGARAFPVGCRRRDGAELLFNAAGSAGHPFWSVADLSTLSERANA